MTDHEDSTERPGSRRSAGHAALKPHSRHKLRCASDGPLSDSWAEIERQLASSGSTRNGHKVVCQRSLATDCCRLVYRMAFTSCNFVQAGAQLVTLAL